MLYYLSGIIEKVNTNRVDPRFIKVCRIISYFSVNHYTLQIFIAHFFKTIPRASVLWDLEKGKEKNPVSGETPGQISFYV